MCSYKSHICPQTRSWFGSRKTSGPKSFTDPSMLILRWPNLNLTLQFFNVFKWYFRGTMRRFFSHRWVMLPVDVGWRNPLCLVTLSDASMKFLIYQNKTGWFQIHPFFNAKLTIGWSLPNDQNFSNGFKTTNKKYVRSLSLSSCWISTSFSISSHFTSLQPADGSDMFQHSLGETQQVSWT